MEGGASVGKSTSAHSGATSSKSKSTDTKASEKSSNAGGGGTRDGGRGGNNTGSKSPSTSKSTDTKDSNTKSNNSGPADGRDHQDTKSSPDTRGSPISGASRSTVGKPTKAGEHVSEVFTHDKVPIDPSIRGRIIGPDAGQHVLDVMTGQKIAQDPSIRGRMIGPTAGQKVTDVFGQEVAQDPSIEGRLKQSLGEIVAKTRGLEVPPNHHWDQNVQQLQIGGYPRSYDPFTGPNLVHQPVPAGQKVTDVFTRDPVGLDPSISGVMNNMFNERPPDIKMADDGTFKINKMQDRIAPPEMMHVPGDINMERAIFGEKPPGLPHDMLSMQDPQNTLGIPQADPTAGRIYGSLPPGKEIAQRIKTITDRVAPEAPFRNGVTPDTPATATRNLHIDPAGVNALQEVHIKDAPVVGGVPLTKPTPPAQSSSVVGDVPPHPIRDAFNRTPIGKIYNAVHYAKNKVTNTNELYGGVDKPGILHGLLGKIFNGSTSAGAAQLAQTRAPHPGSGGTQSSGNEGDQTQQAYLQALMQMLQQQTGGVQVNGVQQ